MKICPQCDVAYQDDYVFCLSDGNSLLDESGEQETRLVNRIVFPERTSALSPDMLVACESCGLANRAKSKFCKKCGVELGDHGQVNRLAQQNKDLAFGFEIYQAAPPPPHSAFPSGPEPTMIFQPGKFTPPQSQTANVAVDRKGRQLNIAVVLISIVLVTIIAALVYSSGLENSRAAANSN